LVRIFEKHIPSSQNTDPENALGEAKAAPRTVAVGSAIAVQSFVSKR